MSLSAKSFAARNIVARARARGAEYLFFAGKIRAELGSIFCADTPCCERPQLRPHTRTGKSPPNNYADETREGVAKTHRAIVAKTRRATPALRPLYDMSFPNYCPFLWCVSCPCRVITDSYY